MRVLVFLAVSACLLALPVRADELLTDTGFETGTAGNNFNVGPQFFVPTTGPFNVWRDVNQWQYASGGVGGLLFASHVTNGNNTNLLYQGVDVSGGLASNKLMLEFDWIFEGGGSNRDVWVLGLSGAGETIQKFAPFFPSNNSESPPGDILLHMTESELTTTATGTFQHFTKMIMVADPNAYDAIVVAIKVSSSGNSNNWALVRGVDNVSLKTVPEPGILALMTAGVAFVGWRRRRRTC